MWWRIFIPSWRFFDQVTSAPKLQVLVGQSWIDIQLRARAGWTSLFFNPEGGLFHARNNLFERLLSEAQTCAKIEELVSFRLVEDLVGGAAFRLIAQSSGEVLLKSEGRTQK